MLAGFVTSLIGIPSLSALSVRSVGALRDGEGNWELHVVFSGPVALAEANDLAHYQLRQGTLNSVRVLDALLDRSQELPSGERPPGGWLEPNQAVILQAEGLVVTESNALTVGGILDAVTGERLDEVVIEFIPSSYFFAESGTPQLSGQVLALGDEGFEILSNGARQWSDYDEVVLAYQEVTGDFDLAMRVPFQATSSRWARAGLMVRENLNREESLEVQAMGTASRYVSVHANPLQAYDLQDTGVSPGNGRYESHVRAVTGGITTTVTGVAVAYPNAWVRLVRQGQVISSFYSNAVAPRASDWVRIAVRDFTSAPLAERLFLGPSYCPETANIHSSNERVRQGLFRAQFRFGPQATPYVSQATALPDGFRIDLKNHLPGALALAGVSMSVDGEPVTPQPVPLENGLRLIWQTEVPWEPGTVREVDVAVAGNPGLNEVLRLRVPDYVAVEAALRAETGNAVSAREGFLLRRAVVARAGVENERLAETALAGVAEGRSYWEDADEWDRAVNVQQAGEPVGRWTGFSEGAFNRLDDRIPGIAAETLDFVAVEFVGLIEFPTPGAYELGFRSRNGFRVHLGRDLFDRMGPGLTRFEGRRLGGEERMHLWIAEPGRYPIRAMVYGQSGDLSAEWFSVARSGEAVLLNDPLVAERMVVSRPSAPLGSVIVSSLYPTPGATQVPPNLDLELEFGGDVSNLDLSAIQVLVDEVDVPLVRVDGSGSIQLRAESNELLLPGSEHRLELRVGGAEPRRDEWVVEIADYQILPDTFQSPLGSALEPGFSATVHQRAVPRPPGPSLLAVAEQQLAGELTANENVASLAQAPAELSTVNVDFNGGASGLFTVAAGFPDAFIPGIPGIGGGAGHLVVEWRTFVAFAAPGFYTFGIRSSDAFRTTTAVGENSFSASPDEHVVLGFFDGGRAGNTSYFSVWADQPGLYPLRTLWAQGFGGGHFEWMTRDPLGRVSLLNGEGGTRGIRAFQTRSLDFRPVGIEFIRLNAEGEIVIHYEGVLLSSGRVGGEYEVVPGAESPFRLRPEGDQLFFRVESP